MNLEEEIADLKRQVNQLARLIHYPADERGGVELAMKVLPYTHPEYVYQLARQNKIPFRRILGRYEFSRAELEAWKDAGCPQPANEWAKEYRESITIGQY